MRTPTFISLLIVPLVLAAPVQAQRTTKASPLTTAEVRQIHTAFRAALGNATVRADVKSAVQQQLRTINPIAFVNGNWVVPIDVAAIYNNSNVRAAIIAQLGASPLTARFGQIASLGVDERLGLAFVPNSLGQPLLGTSVASLRTSLAQAAFLQNTTDMTPGVTLDGVRAGLTGAMVILEGTKGVLSGFADAFTNWWTNTGGPKDPNTGLEMDNPNADPDGDSIPNRLDGDDDADGTPDEEDSAPYDPGTQICYDCMGRASAAFTNVSAASVLKVAVSGHTAATNLAKANKLLSLGSVGQNVTLQIGFGTLQ